MQQNLARAWRSKTFEEMVGQELSVRLLKNCLAKNRLFPVYLFSGLRGSGKTSSGRIFAAALNCERLPLFQKDPSAQTVPCLTCASCQSIRFGSHPDFIEIDAASHTGVDNVRQIIESASFLPVMGTKKVYLIDEAHMLSKAAFNAFLKILEEPPATALFLLATTEPHKILDTVKSRCFHIFFDPIPHDVIGAHLTKICQAEQVDYEAAGCLLIARNSEGSARDALTIMERVILAEGAVTSEGVHRTLGLLHDAVVVRLFEVIAGGSVPELLAYCASSGVARATPTLLWERIVAVLRALLWLYSGAAHEDGAYVLDVSALRVHYPLPLVLEFFDLFYRSESHFLKTTSQHAALEMLLCKMTQRCGGGDVEGASVRSAPQRGARAPAAVQQQHAPVPTQVRQDARSVDGATPPSVTSDAVVLASLPAQGSVPQGQEWAQFMQLLEAGKHPIATSIFRQGTFVAVEGCVVRVQFAQKFEFYREWLVENEGLWKSALEQSFGVGAVVSSEFVTIAVAPAVERAVPVRQRTAAEPAEVAHVTSRLPQSTLSYEARPVQKSEPRIEYEKVDTSDAQRWQTTHMITQLFPGTVTVRKE